MADPKPLVLVCPECGAFGPPQLFAADDDNKAFAAKLADIGCRETATIVARYLGLFRPLRRRLTAPRANRLLDELVPQLQAQMLSFDGHVHPAPLAAWRAAMTEMLDQRERITLPLDTHNYLYKVVIRKASEQAGRREDMSQSIAVGITAALPAANRQAENPKASAPSRDEQMDYAAATARAHRGYATAADRDLISRFERRWGTGSASKSAAP